MRATMLMVALVFTHVQYGEAAPGDLLFTIPNPTRVAGGFFGVSVATTPTGDFLVGASRDWGKLGGKLGSEKNGAALR